MNSLAINFAGPPGPGLTDEQQALIDQAIAVGETVPNITPTSGEKLAVTSSLFEARNDATVILVGGRPVGMVTPAGKTGATSFITPRIRFRRKEAKRLAGSTIRVRVAMTATVGYLAATPFGGNAVRVDRKDGAIDLNVGVALPAVQEAGSASMYRDYLYVMQGDEVMVGGTLQIGANSPTAAERRFEVMSISYDVIAGPADTATTGADAVLDNRLAALAPSVDVFRAVRANLTLAGGAQPMLGDDGRKIGASLVAGQNGKGTVLQWLLPLTGALRAALAGAQPVLTLEFRTQPGWDRDHTLNMQLGKSNLGFLNFTTADRDDYQTLDLLTGLPTRRVMTFSFAAPADLTEYTDLRAFVALTDDDVATVDEQIVLTGYRIDIYRTAGDAALPSASTAILGAEMARAAAVDQAVATIAGTGQRVGAMLRASDFGSIAEALVAASAKASPGALAIVDLDERIYYERNLGKITTGADGVLPGQDGANVGLRGKGMGRTIIDGSQAADTAIATIRATSTLDFNGSQYLEKLTVRAKNQRYGAHIDSVRFKDNIHLLWREVEIEHLGNAEADAYWGQPVWASPHAYALGVTSGSYFGFYGCRAKSRRAAFSAHDQIEFADPAIVEWVGGDLTAVDAGGWSYRLESIGSMVMNRALLADAPLGGEISMAAQPWLPTALDQQPADHRCWELTGRNNSPAAFRIQDFGRALRIKSLTTGTGSRIRVSGSLVPVLFGGTGVAGVTYVDGDVGLAGSAHGLVDIQETVGVGPASDLFITSLKARLGNRTSAPLAMTVEVDALPPVNITLNADYSAMTNAQIRAVLNAPLAGIAEVSEYAIGERYRPVIADEERSLQNTSGTTILMGMALAQDSDGARTVRPMTSADLPNAFAGIAWEDIRPNAHGRVKTSGWLPLTDLLRTGGAAVALGEQFGIDPDKPGYVVSGRLDGTGILQVVRPSLGTGLTTVEVRSSISAEDAIEAAAVLLQQAQTTIGALGTPEAIEQIGKIPLLGSTVIPSLGLGFNVDLDTWEPSGIQAVVAIGFSPKWQGTEEGLVALVKSAPEEAEQYNDAVEFETALLNARKKGWPLAWSGAIYINDGIDMVMQGKGIELLGHARASLVGGPRIGSDPDITDGLLKFANTSSSGGTASRSAIGRVRNIRMNAECMPNSIIDPETGNPVTSNDLLTFTGFYDVSITYSDFYAGRHYNRSPGGDAANFVSTNKFTLWGNNYTGFRDVAVYVSGSGNGQFDYLGGQIGFCRFYFCANGWAAKRNYQNLRAISNYHEGGRNGEGALPATGSGDGLLSASNITSSCAHFHNMANRCIDFRDSHDVTVIAPKITGTFGREITSWDEAGQPVYTTLAEADAICFQNVARGRATDISTDVTFTASGHSAVRCRSGSVDCVVTGTVKGIYTGFRETGVSDGNDVMLTLDADVVVPFAREGGSTKTRFRYTQGGTRMDIIGGFDRTPGRTPFSPTNTASINITLDSIDRAVVFQTAGANLNAILPPNAPDGARMWIYKDEASSAHIVQARDPTNTTTISRLMDPGGIVEMVNKGGAWLEANRSRKNGYISIYGSTAALVPSPPANSFNLFLDTDNANRFSIKDGSGVVTSLGTAATVNTGTSGATVPLLNGANTWSGSQTISHPSGSSALVLNVVDGQQAYLTLRNAGVEMWKIGKNNTANSGSNTGSDFALTRHNDTGSLLGTSIFITRSNGDISLGGATRPNADGTLALGGSSNRWNGTYTIRVYYTATLFDAYGAGSPEGSLTASIGSTYRRTDGGAATSFYVKESGTGNTGWTAK